ncbi:MAG: hypothetical protein JXR68_10200 [Bacteroidales bacterium]|nr:hypothetical protein [Bacteroidales bacterium]
MRNILLFFALLLFNLNLFSQDVLIGFGGGFNFNKMPASSFIHSSGEVFEPVNLKFNNSDFNLFYKKHIYRNFFVALNLDSRISQINFKTLSHGDTIFFSKSSFLNPGISLEYVFFAVPNNKFFIASTVFYQNLFNQKDWQQITYGLGTYTTDYDGNSIEETATDKYELDNYFNNELYSLPKSPYFLKFETGYRLQSFLFFELTLNYVYNFYDFWLIDNNYFNLGFEFKVGKVF